MLIQMTCSRARASPRSLAESEDEQEFALTLHERETAITYSVSDTAPVVYWHGLNMVPSC